MDAACTDRSGFSLIEMLITLVLLGILATIMWMRVEGMNQEAYRAAVQADIKSVAVAQELYHNANMQYGAIDNLGAYQSTEGVTVTLEHADSRGYAITATHAGLDADEVCGFFSGTVPDGAAAPADEPGVSVCH